MKQITILLLFVTNMQIIAQVPVTTKDTKTESKIVSPATQISSTTQTSGITQPYQPASKLITDGKEPAGLQGYIAWVDPQTMQKHMIKGQDNRSGEWKYAYEYPDIIVEFNRGVEWVGLGSGGNYYVPVDNQGREMSKYSSNWTESPAAFKYNIKFQFDLNYNGIPVLMDDYQTIRYNPNTYKFYDIKIQLAFLNVNSRSGVTIPMDDFPDRPIEQKRRATKYTDLPNF
jgi:hypothetical protein